MSTRAFDRAGPDQRDVPSGRFAFLQVNGSGPWDGPIWA
jgi:hypothetical protein